jgi:protein TonB
MATLANSFITSGDTDEFNHDRLGFAFCVALALHAAFILGVSFNPELRTPAPAKLEITLAQHQSLKAPEEADFLAQNNQLGSGTLEEKAMLTSREAANFNDTQTHEVAPPQQTNASEQQAAKAPLLTTTSASRLKVKPKLSQQEKRQDDHPDQAEMTIAQRTQEIASLEAKLDLQRQAYSKRPRIRRLTSMATKQADDALYLHNWRTKIEAIGNQHYPQKARQQHLLGDLRLLVSVLPNGEVFEVKILQSSGHNILDQAAIKIVYLAAPYDPFPMLMQREVDVLEIIRTWRFQKNGLTSST